MTKYFMAHTKYTNPELLSVTDIVDNLISRNETITSDEFWLSLFSLRRVLEYHIENIINNWVVSEEISKNKYSSYGNIISWKGGDMFKTVFIEYLNMKGLYGNENYFGVNSEIYLRLAFDKMKPSKLIEKREEFTKKVCQKLRIYDREILDKFSVNCYLGIVSGNTSSSRVFPRFEVNIHTEKEYPDLLDSCIKLVSDYYFSKNRLELNKVLYKDLNEVKYSFLRKRKNQIPEEFLKNIVEKLEIIAGSSKETLDDLVIGEVKVTRDSIEKTLYQVFCDYIKLVEDGNYETFLDLLESTSNKKTIDRSKLIKYEVVKCPCCNSLAELCLNK